MNLNELLNHQNIIIQCHDIPDADTVGSGYAMQAWFKSHGKDAKLVYGGPAEIQKPSLLLLLEALEIEIDYVNELPGDTDLLITVDCQRGAGNVKKFDLPEDTRIVIIDHHRPEVGENEFTIIRPNLSSCATVVWDILDKEGFAMDDKVRNALYYGLYSDTNGLSELRHPLDRDLAEVPCDTGLVRKLKNSAITADELDIVGKTLQNKVIIGGIGLFRAEPCDANLLGFTSDIAQQVVHIDCCIAYCLQPFGIKLSIRSSVREIMASEIAAFLCKGVGSGGGASEKAGGFMSNNGIKDVAGELNPEDYLKQRVHEYTTYYDLIYAGNNDIDFGAMEIYRKLPNPVGFARSTDIFPAGTKITIRTLEGDVDTSSGEDIYLMIGIIGEVYPIKKERFELSYNVSSSPYISKLEYTPAILNRITGERRELLPFAKTCIPSDEKLVRATKLEKPTKVFTTWDLDKYFSGVIGDWLVTNEGNYADCYIVRSDIFDDTYAILK